MSRYSPLSEVEEAATANVGTVLDAYVDFNSHAHEGRDAEFTNNLNACKLFQLTRPRGA